MTAIPLALVGIGKIARDQHVPALERSDAFHLAAAASRHGVLDGVAMFEDIAALLGARPDVAAVSLCTPPVGRYAMARTVLESGRHLMLEKPPGSTVAEVQALHSLAQDKGLTLFCTWHSREAAAVDAARDWLASRTVLGGSITWREDVRRWHPGQTWIWEPGGLGVFDPGINALSILTRILPGAVTVASADLDFPSNCQTPVAARIDLRTGAGAAIAADLDFLQTGPQTWNIVVDTDAGQLMLTEGGANLTIDGQPITGAVTGALDGEYPRLYRRFAALIRSGWSEADLTPFQLVADAFLLGRRREVAAFHP